MRVELKRDLDSLKECVESYAKEIKYVDAKLTRLVNSHEELKFQLEQIRKTIEAEKVDEYDDVHKDRFDRRASFKRQDMVLNANDYGRVAKTITWKRNRKTQYRAR